VLSLFKPYSLFLPILFTLKACISILLTVQHLVVQLREAYSGLHWHVRQPSALPAAVTAIDPHKNN